MFHEQKMGKHSAGHLFLIKTTSAMTRKPTQGE
jgi:hypothetical protein